MQCFKFRVGKVHYSFNYKHIKHRVQNVDLHIFKFYYISILGSHGSTSTLFFLFFSEIILKPALNTSYPVV